MAPTTLTIIFAYVQVLLKETKANEKSNTALLYLDKIF